MRISDWSSDVCSSDLAAIRRVFEAAAALGDEVPLVYLEDYDMALALRMCSGCDVWLNTPLKPQEASGTSGMKELGRASCRERVCPYVEMSVVHVALRKTTHKLRREERSNAKEV